MAEPKLLTEPQLSVALSTKPRTLRAWRQQRRIPFLRIGRCVRYELDKVLSALRKYELLSK